MDAATDYMRQNRSVSKRPLLRTINSRDYCKPNRDWLRDTNLIFSNSYYPPWFKNLYNWICYDLFPPSLFVHDFLVAIIHPLRSAKKFKSGLPPDLGYLPFWSDAVPDTLLALLTMLASHSLSKCKFLECFHISQCPVRKPVIS